MTDPYVTAVENEMTFERRMCHAANLSLAMSWILTAVDEMNLDDPTIDIRPNAHCPCDYCSDHDGFHVAVYGERTES